MNRRQKMKRMKQKLEWYQSHGTALKPTVVYPSERYEIRTFVAERIFSIEEVEFLGEDDIHDILAEDLLEGVKEVMDIRSYCGVSKYAEAHYYRAELKVASPRT